MCSAAKRVVPVVCLFVICVAAFAAQATLSVEARRKVLSDFFTEYWDYQMRTNPLEASARGDKRWNDKLADFSQEFLDKDLLQNKIFLDRLEAIDTSGFPDQEVVSKRILVHDLKTTLEGARFKPWEMAVTQENGPQIEVPGLFTLLSFESVKDYEDYISRLKALPLLFDQTVIQLRKGIADQLMPPRFILEKVVDQCTNITSKAPDDSAFTTPFKNFPKSISDADKTRLTNDGLAAIRNGVLPAYAHFAQFVSQDYAPHGRVEPGVWSLPNGDAYYAFRVKESTTTDLTPDEIHQLGLAQVKEIEGEMNAVATKLGYADFKSFNAALATDPKVHGQSRQQILDLYKHYVDQMYPKLPELFYRLPKAKLVVLPVEEFKEKDASSASYVLPAEDGSRPGRVMVNTGDFAKRSTLGAESTPITRVCRATTCRSPWRWKQRIYPSSGGTPSIPPTSKAGAFTRNGWERKSDFTRTPICTTGISRTRCCAPYAWSSTPACTRNIGRASKWWTIFTHTPSRMRSAFNRKRTVTSRGPVRRWATKSASSRFWSFANTPRISSATNTTFEHSTMKS